MARSAEGGFRSPVKARLALALALLAGAVVLFAPSEASAQILPAPGQGDYCSEWSSKTYQGPPATFRAVPAQANLNVAMNGSGNVRATMFGTPAPCINNENSVLCTTSCTLVVQPVCEFHCYHDHTAPYHWDVELAAQPGAGLYHVGWDRPCRVRAEAPRSSCFVLMNSNQSATALFSTTPDTTPPSAPAASPGGSTPYSATVNWTPAADNVWLGGYEIIQNGSKLVARVSPGTSTYKIENISCQTTYTFQVKAYDAANETSSNPVQVTTGQCLVAARPRPNTIIHVKPPVSTRQRRAFFHFGQRGTIRATKYQCKLDRGRWVACSGRTGKTYRNLKPGYHTFYVRAGNAVGFDLTPAKHRWRIRR